MMKNKVWYYGLVSVIGVVMFTSCEGGKEPVSHEVTSVEVKDTVVSENKELKTDGAQLDPALELMRTSDCYTCHQDADQLVGPSFIKIAEKYEASEENISLLSNKIIKGGVGVWGQVPMQAHPTINSSDAEKMVRYILSLK